MNKKRAGLASLHSKAAAIESLENRRYLATDFSFGAPTARSTPGVEAASFTINSFDGDAYPDLAVGYQAKTKYKTASFAVLLGNGDGSLRSSWTFSDMFLSSPSVKSGNWNGDSTVDVIFSSLYSAIDLESGQRTDIERVNAYSGDGQGQQGTGGGKANSFDSDSLRDFTTADLNNDSKTDIVTTGPDGLVLHQASGQQFNSTPLYTSISSFFVTVNALNITGKGYRDVITTLDDGSGNYKIAVMPRTVTGGYGTLVIGQSIFGYPQKLRMADFNGDGKLDVSVLSSRRGESRVRIAMGNGDGTFKQGTDYAARAIDITIGDFDLDGRQDVAYARSPVDGADTPAFEILRNRGDETFEIIANAVIDAGIDQIDSADFNNDGKPDLIYRYQDSKTLAVVLNTATRKNVIRGTLYEDSNENRVRDAGEKLLANRTVYLDLNDDGVQDRREPSTTTLAAGWYEFRVADGVYRVRQAIPSPWIQTTPYSATAKSGANQVTVSGIVSSLRNDFGSFNRGIISGFAFNDSNANNVFDPTESGLANVTIFLEDGTPDGKIALTDANGRYRFDVPNGTYRFFAAVLVGRQSTGVFAYNATVVTNKFLANYNFGQTRPGIISGHVFYDYAVNARRDDGDEGVGGLQVFIDLDNDGVVDPKEPTTVTSTSRRADLRGGYQFTELYPKSYVVRLVKPPGYLQVPLNDFQGNPNVAGAGPGTGGPNTTFASGGNDTAYTDFSVIRPIKVSGRAYVDTDANGRMGAAEVGLGTVPVFIDYNGNGFADLEEPQTTTAANGNYTLTSSRAGTFNIRASLKSGVNATRPSSHLYAVSFVDGAAVTTGINFGLAIGAFSTAPYANPVNITGVANPTALASGDFNGDRRQDVIVASNAGQSRVYLGNGRGVFTPGQALLIGDSTRFMVAVDVSGDGKPDLVAANESVGSGATILINTGNGTFANAVEYDVTTNTYGVVAADFNGDLATDLAFVGTSDSRIALLMNQGNGVFSGATFITDTYGGRSIAAGDVNGDRKADLVVVHPDANTASVFLGNGAGGFARIRRDITSGLSRATFVTLADFNTDGKLDIVAVNESADDVRVKLGLGNGTFADGASYSTASTPTQVAVLDIDSDGKLDLIVSCRSDGTTNISGGVSIIRGRGDGSFVEQQVRTAHTSPTAVAIADFNGDRRLDILAANFFSDDVSLLLNNTGA